MSFRMLTRPAAPPAPVLLTAAVRQDPPPVLTLRRGQEGIRARIEWSSAWLVAALMMQTGGARLASYRRPIGSPSDTLSPGLIGSSDSVSVATRLSASLAVHHHVRARDDGQR
jgi:hypothetical protein